MTQRVFFFLESPQFHWIKGHLIRTNWNQNKGMVLGTREKKSRVWSGERPLKNCVCSGANPPTPSTNTTYTSCRRPDSLTPSLAWALVKSPPPSGCPPHAISPGNQCVCVCVYVCVCVCLYIWYCLTFMADLTVYTHYRLVIGASLVWQGRFLLESESHYANKTKNKQDNITNFSSSWLVFLFLKFFKCSWWNRKSKGGLE